MNMKLSGRTQMFPQYSLIESLDVIKQLGFDGVEICVERLDWTLHDLDAFPIRAINRKVAELELSPVVFSFHQDYIYDDERLELTKQAIMMTPKLNTDLLIIGGTPKRSGDRVEWDRMIQRTRELTAVAEDCGVLLAEEFEPGFIVGSTVDLLRMFEEVGSPNLAANLDLGHLFLCDPDPLASIHQVGEKVKHCHISNMPRGVHDHELPNKGDMDLLAYLRALQAIGFSGGMALDLYKYAYESIAAESVQYLRGLIERLTG